jgi:hypothetical protein
MARKRSTIVLNKLKQDSAIKLESMLGELTGCVSDSASDSGKPSRWNRRFAASGKFNLIRPFGKS